MEIVRDFIKILIFSDARGLCPRTPSDSKYWIVSMCPVGRPADFREKWMLQAENLGKSDKFASVGGSATEPPGRIEFSIIIRFLSKSAQKYSWNLWKLIFIVLHDRVRYISWDFSYLGGGGSIPWTPHYSLVILHSLFFSIIPPLKIKNSAKFAFLLYFSQ